jgi:transcription initiation factor TFIIB
MVRLPSPNSRRFQKSQTDDDDHQEQNQNYHYHQKQCIPQTERYPIKENENNNQNAPVVESQEQHVLFCSICKISDKLVTDPESGEIICSNCGMVISDKIQQINKPEWRTVDTEQVNNNNNNGIRTGAPTSIARHDMGLATVIGRTDKDASGHKIDAQMRSTMERLRKWDFRTQRHTATDRNLSLAFNELDKLKDKLGLPDAVFQKAAYIYRKAQARGLTRGRTIPSVLAAAIYIACREMGISKTLKDIVTASNIRRKNISKTYRKLLVELDYKVPVSDPMKCISRVANNANLSEKTKHQALYIMNEVAEKEISVGKNPMGLAATVLYVSCLKTGENKAQKDIAGAASVTEVTLRNRLKDLKSKIELSN